MEANEASTELDDRSNQFEIVFPVKKKNYENVKHKEEIIGYDSKHCLYTN